MFARIFCGKEIFFYKEILSEKFYSQFSCPNVAGLH